MGQLRHVTAYYPGAVQVEVDYSVDALGRRASRTVTVVNAGTGLPAGVTPGTIGWVYGDGPNPIAEFDEAGRLRKHFVYLTGSHVPTYFTEYNTLGQRVGTRALITDERHSLRAVVDTTTGAILQTLRYDPFGYVIQETGAGTQPFGFAGGLYDPATQYVRFGFRDYDPNIGRWTAPDPIGFGGGDDDLYGYVGGDPVNRVDPWGLITEVIFWEPAGYRESSLGHVSVSIEGVSYSWGPGGMDVRPHNQYIARNVEFRSARGLVLNLTTPQERYLEEWLLTYEGHYGSISNNCTDPLESGLVHVGERSPELDSVLPTGLLHTLDSLAIAQTYYRGAGSRTWLLPWSCAMTGSLYAQY